MIERGTVVAAAAGLVDVAIQPAEACESCGGCVEGAGGKRFIEGVVNAVGATVGDLVEVETARGARRAAQALLYGVPVAAALVGYLAGFLLGSWAEVAPDQAGAVVSVIAFAAAVVFVGRAGRVLSRRHPTPQVRAIIARCCHGTPGRGRAVDVRVEGIDL